VLVKLVEDAKSIDLEALGILFSGWNTMDELKLELKNLVIKATNLDDVEIGEIEDGLPLFVEGLGLDSIDALELSVALESKYGINISDSDTAKAAFGSINTLAEFVAANRTK
jgi:acyl carrier protein